LPFFINVTDRSTAARIFSGLGQSELTKLVGTDQGHISRIKNGDVTPPPT
jgi:predicted transcriptional regulator